MNTTLSIVLINYNTNELTSNAIDSIKAQTRVDYEIIVIDNCSPKEDPGVLLIKHPDIQLIRSDENMGFGKANNLGISKAKGDYVLLLNTDTIIVEGALDKCVAFMESEVAISQDIGLMGCKLLNEDGSYQHSTFEAFNLWTWMISSNAILNRLTQRQSAIVAREGRVAGVSGAFMLFRRSTLDVLKGKWFDPDIFMYSEETELCRSRVANICQIFYWPHAEVIHLVGGSTPSDVMSLQMSVSFALTWYKRGSLYYCIYLLWSLVNMLSDCLILPVVKRNNRKVVRQRLKNYFAGLGYLFWEIPKYPRKWGGRPTSLNVLHA